jgi:NADH-quinone oxidoreductase subunit H
MAQLFSILIFPGFLFLAVFGLAAEYFDRKLYARLQNRVGPPWFQTFADFLKLVSKEDIIPAQANPRMFKMMPILAVTATVTAFFYIPLWREQPLFSFNGDVIVVLYLLTIPTQAFFLGGWFSTSLYSGIGAVRSLTQLFAYEVPLFTSVLAAALLADTWSLREMAAFYSTHPWYWPLNLLGFGVALITLLGKLEKVPFDIPEAETEIVAGTFTEYSGRLLAFFRLGIDMESVVASALLAAVFLPFGLNLPSGAGLIVFIVKVIFVIGLLSILRTLFARLRIDQMMIFCWKFLAPLAFLQLLINLVLKGVLVR